MAASFERTEEQDGFHHSVDVADLTITDSIPGGGAACEDPRGTDAADMVSALEISSAADVPGHSALPPIPPRRAPHEESMKNKDTIQDQGSSLIPTGVGEVPTAPTAAAATPTTGEPEVPTLVELKDWAAQSFTDPSGVLAELQALDIPYQSTNGLLINAKEVVRLLKKESAASICQSPERPDLPLSGEEAIGWLLAYAQGRRLLEHEARPIGKVAGRQAGAAQQRLERLQASTKTKLSKARKLQASAEELAVIEAEMGTERTKLLHTIIEIQHMPKASRRVVDRGRPAGEPEQPKEEHPRGEICPRGHALIEAAMSPEAAKLINAAFNHLYASRIGVHPVFGNEELEVAQVRFKYTLQRFHLRFPEHDDDWLDTVSAPMRVAHWALRWVAFGEPIPAAEECAKHASQYFDMQKVMADVKANIERKAWEVRL